MPSPKAARTTTRRLLTLASLGVAGLLAGLLSGCSPSPASSNLATYTQPRSFESLTRTHQPPSLYTHPLPDLKHPPTPHRIESWADRTPRQTSSPFSSQIDAGPTLSEYAFTGAPSSSNLGSARLTAQ